MPFYRGSRFPLLNVPRAVAEVDEPLLAFDPHVCAIPFTQYLFQDENHTTPVTADSDPVGAWENIGLDGGYFTQATAADKPLYRTDGSLHWAHGDGLSDFMDIPFILTGVDLYVAVGFTPGPHNGTQFGRCVTCADIGEDDFSSASNGIPILRRGTDQTWMGFCNSTILATRDLNDGDTHVLESLWEDSLHTLSLDGVDSSPAASSHTFNCSVMRLFAAITAAGVASNADIELFGIFARRGTLPSSGDRASIRARLAELAGI